MSLIITPVEHRADDFELDPVWLEALWRMEDRHFWHAARNQWVRKALVAAGVTPPGRILEVGCGAGAVAGFLHRSGYQVTGIDTAEVLVRKAHQRCPEATFIAGDVAAVELGEPFDAICLFDVLEHLSDPAALLRASQRHARAGTIYAVTTPALRELHSPIDDISGHKKRYEPGELTQLLRDSGLTPLSERGIFRSTLAVQRRMRRSLETRSGELDHQEKRQLMLDNLRIPPAPVNLALRALCALERTLTFDRARDRPGASLLALARQPEAEVSSARTREPPPPPSESRLP